VTQAQAFPTERASQKSTTKHPIPSESGKDSFSVAAKALRMALVCHTSVARMADEKKAARGTLFSVA
jgi:hypothetical protein